VISAILALGIHAILLGAECNWYKRNFADKPIPRVVTITLASRQPQIPVLKIQDPLSKTLAGFKTPAKKNKEQIPKPKPPKPAAASRLLPAAAVAVTVDNSKPASEPELTETETSKPLAQSSQNSPALPYPGTGYGSIEGAGNLPGQTITGKRFVQEAKPLYRTNPAPEYPHIARLRGYQGHVVLKVLVDREGNVSDLEVSRSSGYPVLDQAAVNSVKKWIFVPAMRGNESVEMWVRIPIRFKLE
jgi:protein TonB